MTETQKKKGTLVLTLILGMLAAIAPLSTDMYLPALPFMQNEFSASTSLIQLTLTTSMVGMALGQIFAGPISDMKGRKLPLLTGLTIFTLASIVCAFATSIYIFLTFRFIQGLSGAAGIVIARAIARDFYKGYALTKFFSMLMLVNGLAPILSPIIGGQILIFSSWRAIFVLLMLIGILLTGSVFFFTKESLAVEDRLPGGLKSSLHSFNVLLKNRYFLGHCLMQCSTFAAFFAYISGSPFVFQNVYGVSAQTFSGIFALNGIGLMLGGIIAGRLAGRIADTSILRYGILQACVGSAILLVCLLLHASLPIILFILFLTISMLSIIASSSFSLAMQSQGKAAGSAAALIGFFSAISGGIMAPLVGIAGSHNAIPMGIIMLLGYLGAAVFFYRMILPAHKK
jgi:DHA1 family bicyclomycin/chloramphenicol resistance-like MFS transporter